MGCIAGVQDTAVEDFEPNWPKELKAWVALFAGFLLMFNSWGIVNAYGTYSSYYMQELLGEGTDILLLNLIGSTQSFMVLLLSAPVGRFLDAGHHKLLIAVGSVIVVLGSFLLSVVNGHAQPGQGNYGLIWLTQGFVTGVGMSCFFVTSSQVAATWFRKRRSFAVGVVASGASISGLVYPVMFRLLNESVGFNNAQRYVSCLTAATCIVMWFAANPNPRHEIRHQDNWFELSVYWDNHAFRNASFCWLTAAISFMFFGFYAVFFELEEWAVNAGVGYRGHRHPAPDDASTLTGALQTWALLGIMNASSTVGRVGGAYASDKLKRFGIGALHIHTVVLTVASILLFAFWTTADIVSAAIAFVVCFGAFSGAVIGLPPASVAYILELDHGQSRLGQWTGMMYSCAALPALTGPLIAGHLITEYDNNFITVQMWTGACLFLAAVCMGMACFCRHRRWVAKGMPGYQPRKSVEPRKGISASSSERQTPSASQHNIAAAEKTIGN
ncbi:MFS general substrate transporter [Teratosphaeria nubilosa]|uniref:MFS general substrate transporter n=1 Tax=Teratosphaeria nubilosa TaxID=161662 RepID=A0A6G1L6H1_9PEZI|nr:MFS general substrate transporter [Teratosphaeria nubilosa]